MPTRAGKRLARPGGTQGRTYAVRGKGVKEGPLDPEGWEKGERGGAKARGKPRREKELQDKASGIRQPWNERPRGSSVLRNDRQNALDRADLLDTFCRESPRAGNPPRGQGIGRGSGTEARAAEEAEWDT